MRENGSHAYKQNNLVKVILYRQTQKIFNLQSPQTSVLAALLSSWLRRTLLIRIQTNPHPSVYNRERQIERVRLECAASLFYASLDSTVLWGRRPHLCEQRQPTLVSKVP